MAGPILPQRFHRRPGGARPESSRTCVAVYAGRSLHAGHAHRRNKTGMTADRRETQLAGGLALLRTTLQCSSVRTPGETTAGRWDTRSACGHAGTSVALPPIGCDAYSVAAEGERAFRA